MCGCFQRAAGIFTYLQAAAPHPLPPDQWVRLLLNLALIRSPLGSASRQGYVQETGLVGLDNYDLAPDALELFSLLMLGQAKMCHAIVYNS